MAYIDELRKYTDQPVYGQGGVFDWIKKLFAPAPQPVAKAPAPKPVPTPAPRPAVVAQKPAAVAPKPATVAYKAPTPTPVSTPQQNTSQPNSTVASRPTNTYSSPPPPSPNPTPTMPKIQINTPQVAQKLPQITLPKSTNNAMADLGNLGSGIVNILGAMSGQTKGMVPTNYNYANDLLKTLGGIVGTAGTIASNTILPKVYAADYKNPYEFGLSELISGTGQPQQAKQPMRSSALAGETSGQILGSTTKAPSYGPLKSGYVSTPGYTQADTALNDARTARDEATTGATQANKENEDIFAILSDPNTQAMIDQANEATYQEYVNGNISYEDYQRKAAEEQQKIIENKYAQAKTEAESQIPGIEQGVNSLVESAQTGLDRYSSAADQEAARQAIIAQEQEKQSVKNQKMSEGNLRNVFANLGTAESSAFIDKLVELTKEAGSEQGKIRSEGARVVGDIGKQKLYETQDTEKYINDTRTKGATDIANVRRFIQNLSGQQADAISGLMTKLYEALGTGQNNLATQKALLADRKAQQAANLQNAMQNYGISSQLNKEYFDATKGLQGVNQNDLIGQTVRPSGLPADMWSLAGQLYNSGLRGVGLINELKKRNGMGWSNWYDTLRNQLAQ